MQDWLVEGKIESTQVVASRASCVQNRVVKRLQRASGQADQRSRVQEVDPGGPTQQTQEEQQEQQQEQSSKQTIAVVRTGHGGCGLAVSMQRVVRLQHCLALADVRCWSISDGVAGRGPPWRRRIGIGTDGVGPFGGSDGRFGPSGWRLWGVWQRRQQALAGCGRLWQAVAGCSRRLGAEGRRSGTIGRVSG